MTTNATCSGETSLLIVPKIHTETLKIHLKKSKTDQLGKGVDVYIRKTGCPLTAIIHYISLRGRTRTIRLATILHFQRYTDLDKTLFHQKSETGSASDRPSAGHSFRIGAATFAAQAGLNNKKDGKMEQFRLPGLRTDPKRAAGWIFKTLAHPR